MSLGILNTLIEAREGLAVSTMIVSERPTSASRSSTPSNNTEIGSFSTSSTSVSLSSETLRISGSWIVSRVVVTLL